MLEDEKSDFFPLFFKTFSLQIPFFAYVDDTHLFFPIGILLYHQSHLVHSLITIAVSNRWIVTLPFVKCFFTVSWKISQGIRLEQFLWDNMRFPYIYKLNPTTPFSFPHPYIIFVAWEQKKSLLFEKEKGNKNHVRHIVFYSWLETLLSLPIREFTHQKENLWNLDLGSVVLSLSNSLLHPKATGEKAALWLGGNLSLLSL